MRNSISLYGISNYNPTDNLTVGQLGSTQVTDVNTIEFTGSAIQSVTNPSPNQALITITGGGLTSIGLNVPSPFSIAGSPLTANGAMTISWATGFVPNANLGSGTSSGTTFLRGDNSWQPVVTGFQVSGQLNLTGTVSLIPGDNINLTQSGNSITISSLGEPGTVTDVSSTLNAFVFTNPNTTPALTIQNVLSPTTQFLRGDGVWATPPVPQPGLTSVGLQAPATFTVGNTPLTSNGNLVLAWSTNPAVVVPTANLGTGTANSTNFLRGDSSWQPVLTSVRITAQSGITGDLTIAAGNNISLAQSGNTITITGSGGGGGGSVVSVTTLLNAFTFTNPTVNPVLTIQNASTPTTQFLRGDGTWAIPASSAGGVTSVGLRVPTGFAVQNSPITTQGDLVIAYSGRIPATSLASNTATNNSFLRGDQTWQVAVTGLGTSAQQLAFGDILLSAGTNVSINQVGNTFTVNATGSVFSVGLTVPSPLRVNTSTITGSGTFDIFWGSGQVPLANLGSGTATSSNFLRGDGTWATPQSGQGTVTRVAMTVPTALTVRGSPITGDGSLDVSWVSNQQIPVGNLGSGTASSSNYLRGDGSWSTPVTSAQVTGQPVINGGLIFSAGANVTLAQSGNVITIAASGGGGGGGAFSTITAVWTTANSASKNAYTTQPTINNDGISISLVASSSPTITSNATIILNTVTLTNTYPVSGSFPNYNIVIPVGDISGSSAETASVVSVVIRIGSQYNLTANNLTNVQPTTFSTVLSGNYASSSLPYYISTSTINYSYGNTIGTITAYNGTITVSGVVNNASQASGSITNVAISGATIGGLATGQGLNGAGLSTINLTGSIPSTSSFTPAFYVQPSTGSTPPTFTTSSLQTPGAEIGSTVTYSNPTQSTQYVWLATTRPASSLRLITSLGPAILVPDVTASQTIANVSFNVFGFTSLSTSVPVQIQIIN